MPGHYFAISMPADADFRRFSPLPFLSFCRLLIRQILLARCFSPLFRRRLIFRHAFASPFAIDFAFAATPWLFHFIRFHFLSIRRHFRHAAADTISPPLFSFTPLLTLLFAAAIFRRFAAHFH
jgi:hypothetical protein